jgi:hypothetical protein
MGGAHIRSANSGQQTRCQDGAGDHRTLGVVEAPLAACVRVRRLAPAPLRSKPLY